MQRVVVNSLRIAIRAGDLQAASSIIIDILSLCTRRAAADQLTWCSLQANVGLKIPGIADRCALGLADLLRAGSSSFKYPQTVAAADGCSSREAWEHIFGMLNLLIADGLASKYVWGKAPGKSSESDAAQKLSTVSSTTRMGAL